MYKFICLVLASSFILFYACNDEDALPKLSVEASLCDTLPSGYAQDVAPIINANCATADCHGDAGEDNKFMRNYEETKKVANTGEFIKAINHRPGADAMPKDADKLSDDEIRIIECWIFNDFPQ